MSLKAEIRVIVKFFGIIFVSFVVVLCGIALFFQNKPPKEKKVIHSFYEHRATYERLREMLIEDKHLVRVANWGVETNKTIGTSKPPAGDFPLDRYNEYVALLKELGAVGAFRDREEPPDSVGVLVYASGFAGDTRHLDICWMAHKPLNQVNSLDDFYKTPKPRKPVYKHIEGNWYLWADW